MTITDTRAHLLETLSISGSGYSIIYVARSVPHSIGARSNSTDSNNLFDNTKSTSLPSLL